MLDVSWYESYVFASFVLELESKKVREFYLGWLKQKFTPELILAAQT